MRFPAPAVFCLAVVMLLLVPAAALAQVPLSDCGTGLEPFTVAPAQGAAGSGFSVSGAMILVPRVQPHDLVPALVSPGPDFEVWWFENGVADATLLGILPSSWDDGTNLASFSGTFTVPVTSVPGQHQVAVTIADSGLTSCEAYMVTTTVQEDAYVQTATSLPSSLPGTGIMLLAPVAGLLAVATGAWAIRKRSR